MFLLHMKARLTMHRAPESEQDILRRGLKEDWSTEDVMVALAKIREDSKA